MEITNVKVSDGTKANLRQVNRNPSEQIEVIRKKTATGNVHH
jgi:hypothetical protein